MTGMLIVLVMLVALRVAWGAWKSTQRDIVRDQLFDLRDEWRDFFIGNGLSMDLPEYARVRDFINHYLRYSCRLRLVGLIYMAAHVREDEFKATSERLDAELASSNQAIAREIRRIRQRAVRAVQAYMVLTSLLIVPLLIVALGACLFHCFSAPIRRAMSAVKAQVDSFAPLSGGSIELAAIR